MFKKLLSSALVLTFLGTQIAVPMDVNAAAAGYGPLNAATLKNIMLTESTKTVGDWTLSTITLAKAAVVEIENGVRANVLTTGSSEDDVQLIHTEPYSLESGEYKLSLSVNCNKVREVRVALEKADDTMGVIVDKQVGLNKGDNAVVIPFSLKNATSAKLSVRLGYFEDDGNIYYHTVEVTNPSIERIGDYVDTNAPTPIPADPNRFKNKLANGDFSAETDGWWGITSVEDGVGIVEVTGGSENPWDVMCGYWKPSELNKGRTYKVSIDIASEMEQDVKVQVTDADDNELMGKTIQVPGDSTMHTYSFDELEVPEDCQGKLAFQLGAFGTEEQTYKISFDNAVISEIPRIVDVKVDNADFSADTDGWWGIAVVEDGVGVVDVVGGSENPWDVMCGYWKPIELNKGNTYTISVDIASEMEQDIKFQVYDPDDNEIFGRVVQVPGDSEMHTYTFEDFEVAEDVMGKLGFQLGAFGTEEDTYKIKFDNVKISYPDLGAPAEEDPLANMIKNPDFSEGTKKWGVFSMEGGKAVFSAKDEAIVNILNTGTVEYAVQLFHDGIKLYKGNKYKLSFRYRADEERNGAVRIQQNGGTYIGYLDDQLEFATE